jgi:hypothetical protein
MDSPDKISGAEISARALALKAILRQHGWTLGSLDSYAMVVSAVANTATDTAPNRDAYIHMIGELRRCLDNASNLLFSECFALTAEERDLLNVGPTTFTRH